MNISVFCDFDGTVLKEDLGDEVFKKFGQFEPLHTQLMAGEMTVAEYWRRIAGTIQSDVLPEEIEEFALGFQLDAYFKSFVEDCREQEIPLTVVSDGFDVYIKPLLKREGLDWLPVRCNRMVLKNGRYETEYPGASESCSCFCASCKRNSILEKAAPDDIIIYIGDGLSDTCGAEHADIIFAKKSLAAYCNEFRLPHHPFKNFFDVRRILKKITTASSLKPRHQAVLKRKKAFEIE
ncbi:MAG TPA: MtnX-like HAD-IB family phosphatase [Patescibacteria group bacterium]|nr:MtnX-like HAD-IB family phosphatase [Patescibacteria group bacterium]